MKKSSYILALLFAATIMFSSCRSQKQACAAYSNVEQPVSAKDNG